MRSSICDVSLKVSRRFMFRSSHFDFSLRKNKAMEYPLRQASMLVDNVRNVVLEKPSRKQLTCLIRGPESVVILTVGIITRISNTLSTCFCVDVADFSCSLTNL